MNYGTLDYVRENNEEFFVINSEYEIELMIKRIIPSHNTFPLRVRMHPENTRLIRMIMKEFPFDIKTDKWNTAQGQIIEQEELAKKVETLDYVEPDKVRFKGELMPFQKQGLDFIIKTNGRTLITDEMGLGKTIESLAFISTKPEAMPVIVVAPLVTLVNWKREIEKFLALTNKRFDKQTLLTDGKVREPKVHLIRHGNVKGKRHRLPMADFYLINYELVSKRYKDLCDLNPKFVIFDEIHSLRNEYTEKYKACFSLASFKSILYRLGLSGTPIYNHGTEMFNICEIIKQGVLGERNEFVRKYCHGYNPDKTTDEGKVGLANVLRKTIMIRRKKIDVLPDLPDKIRLKQEIEIDTDLYESELEKLYEKINVARGQLSQSFTDFEHKEGLFELNKKIREMRIAERQIAGLAKVKHVVEYLEDLLENYDEEKFVVFCHHINVHKAIFDGLWKYNPVQIIGGQGDKARQDAIDRFQNTDKNREASRVIICGLRAGALGINLTSSAYVIFAELDWSPSVHRQAEDRLHRIGQKHKVFAHYLEGTGTFDEILSGVLLRKTVEISDALGDKMESMNNQKAVEFLESKYRFSKTSKIAELIANPVIPDRSQSYVSKRLEQLDDL